MNSLLRAMDRDPNLHMKNNYPAGFDKVDLPEGVAGDWRLIKFEAKREELGLMNLRALRDGYPHRIIPPGHYTRLVRRGTVVMSDTPAEAHENSPAVRRVVPDSNVLINGLGIGFVLNAILKKNPKRVIVVEQSPDVIQLVGGFYQRDPRVMICPADAFTFKPPKDWRFSVVWHDIWDTISPDNLKEMTRLKRRYGRVADWQGCWAEDIARDAR